MKKERKQDMKTVQSSYACLLYSDICEAARFVSHFARLAHKQRGSAVHYIQLDDAAELSKTSAGYEEAFKTCVLQKAFQAQKKDVVIIKYGSFDWKTQCNEAAKDLMVEVCTILFSKPFKPHIVFVLPENKRYVVDFITDTFAIRLRFFTPQEVCKKNAA